MPDIRYVRCDRPLVHELDRIRRIVQKDRLQYVVLDSVGYGTLGRRNPPRPRWTTTGPCDSWALAPTWLPTSTKPRTAINARSAATTGTTPRARRGTSSWRRTHHDGHTIHLAAFNRKNNLNRPWPPAGIRVEFDGDRVYFERIDVTTIDEVAESLPLWQRIRALVKAGPQTLATIASELNHDNVESIDRIVRKHKYLFTKVPGADGVTRIALVERRAS